MGQLSLRQIGIAVGTVLLAVLVWFGFSDTGRRLALGACRPFMATQKFLSRQFGYVFGDAARLEDEKLALSRKVQALSVENQRVSGLLAENRQMRRALKLTPPPEWRFVHGEVLTRDPVAWDTRFTIDCGTADHVCAGAPVLFGGTLIGRVSEVKERCSVVDTVVSTRCHLGVRLDGTDKCGLLQGMGRIAGDGVPGCQVDFLPKDSEVKDGQRLVTSGLGREIPAGLPVAQVRAQDGVAAVEIDHARKQALASPLENWDSMKIVSVIVIRED